MIKTTRKTKETEIEINLNLYGSGKYNINTGIAFFDHMLEASFKALGVSLRRAISKNKRAGIASTKGVI